VAKSIKLFEQIQIKTRNEIETVYLNEAPATNEEEPFEMGKTDR
jgi:hypothetical protein